MGASFDEKKLNPSMNYGDLRHSSEISDSVALEYKYPDFDNGYLRQATNNLDILCRKRLKYNLIYNLSEYAYCVLS